MSRLKITTGASKMSVTNPKPMHPGRVLSEVYMHEMGLNKRNWQQELAVHIAR